MIKPTILLVDDFKFFLELERQFLRQTEARVLTASSGKDALKLARKEPPDLIVLDFDMPEMSGEVCFHKVKDDPLLRSIPVILVCDSHNEQHQQACKKLDCGGVLTKPLHKRTFLDMGRKLLAAIDRREKRLPFKSTVFFTNDAGSFYGTSLDLSPGGIFVQHPEPIQVDERIRLHFVLADDPNGVVGAVGRVAWTSSDRLGAEGRIPKGFGVEFLQLDEGAAEHLKAFLAKPSEREMAL